MVDEFRISLTYDACEDDHLDRAIPELGRLGVSATFFVAPERLVLRANEWRQALVGHELGDGCLLTAGSPAGLPLWTRAMVAAEIESCRELCREELGRAPELFAYPAGQPLCADGNYQAAIGSVYRMARGGEPGINMADSFDPQWLRSRQADCLGQIGLMALATEARKQRAWLILRWTDIPSWHGAFLTWLAQEHRDAVRLMGP